MLPAEGMEPVHGMDIEKVNAKLRGYLGKLRGTRGQNAKNFWGIIHLGKRLAKGVDIEGWRDTWARDLLINLRSPEIIHIDEDDSEAARENAANYEEF